MSQVQILYLPQIYFQDYYYIVKSYFIIIFSLTITFCSVDSDGTILSDEEISNESNSATSNDEQNSTTSSLDNREIKYFIAESVSNEHQEMLKKWVAISEELYFTQPNVVIENLYPIYLVQLDRNNSESAFALEPVYCEFLEEEHKKLFVWDGYDSSRCGDNEDAREEYERNGLFVEPNGGVAHSQISSIPQRDGYNLFVSKTHDLPEHASSMGYVTLHEMFHIFQTSHYSTDSYDEQRMLNGRFSGDNPEDDVPWWNEGTAVYFSYIDYARTINDMSWFKDEMYCTLLCERDRYGNKSRLEIFKETGVKLNNITFSGNPEPIDKQIAYEIGAWFVAYLVNDHGEDKILDIYSLYDEFGFEKSFEMQFGKDYRTYLEEFYEFLDLPEDQLMGILLSK